MPLPQQKPPFWTPLPGDICWGQSGCLGGRRRGVRPSLAGIHAVDHVVRHTYLPVGQAGAKLLLGLTRADPRKAGPSLAVRPARLVQTRLGLPATTGV